ncbi:hypothetical protein RhiJN_22628 [Ceratobasidium sp. AG-Ba]|nr:hypothetical protein RhiJN_22628 [Ceratobasidium sp. AG-Ba]
MSTPLDRPPPYLRHRIQEIQLQPAPMAYPISLKILVDSQEIHRTPTIPAGRPLIWGDIPYFDVKFDHSRIEIRVYEHHTFSAPRIGSAEYAITDIGESLITARDCNASGLLVTITHPHPESDKDVAAKVLSIASATKRQKRLLEKLGPARNVIAVILEVGGAVAELDPRAKAVFGLVDQAWKKLEGQGKCDASVDELVQGLLDILPAAEAVKQAARLPQLQDTIKAIWGLIEDASKFVIEYNSAGETASVLRMLGGSNAQEKVDDMLTKLKRLKETFDRGISIQTFQKLDESIRRNLLEKLKPLSTAQFDASRVCLPGTREQIIQEILDWATFSVVSGSCIVKDKVMWVYGQAGLGKSSIATSVCKGLDNRRLLASSFFCKRDDAARRDCQRILSTIIFGLATRYPAYALALERTFEEDSMLPGSPMQNQFDKLIQAILESPELAPSETDHVVVVDALDECASVDDRAKLLGYLVRICSLVPTLKIIITSRPDSDIKEFFEGADQTSLQTRDVRSYDASGDISLLVNRLFAQSKKSNLLPKGGAAMLVERAAGLFIWARTACEFVLRDIDPRKAFQAILGSAANAGSPKALDDLYTTAIKAGIQQEDRVSHAVDAVKKCLGAIILCSTRTPLSITALSKLYGDWVDENILLSVVEGLGSVLYLDHDQGDAVRVYHASFADYLLDEKRSGEYNPKMDEHNCHVARRCLEVLMNELRFNICGLETSYKRNREVENLDSRIDKNIKPHLRYSCKYWASHLINVAAGQLKLFNELLERFLQSDQLLFWIEALSLLSIFKIGISDTISLQRLYQGQDKQLFEALKDVVRFMQTFSLPIIESAPHLSVKKAQKPKFSNGITVKAGLAKEWAQWSQLIPQAAQVCCVTFSPNGRRIVSGSFDNTVRVWDAETGAQIGDPLAGHSHSVTSVAYSPDGRRIVSGSGDKTVRVWDAEKGAQIGDPLAGHSHWVTSVAYSPDGRRIVSGSVDKTVRVWDAETGAQIGDPLAGHSHSVRSVAYSPDGRRIVSGSVDKTVRVWDAETGAQIGDPLAGHSHPVTSVAYSPDGRRIVSGSYDNTVRVWDAETGAQIGDPLAGHSDLVTSVAYSPDGRRIVSGSYDNTVRVWDAETGAQIGDPLAGHSDLVTSVAYSPDGRRIVSGSYDNTVRVWDAETGAQIGDPLAGHSFWITSVAYSPDGRRIVSGSVDKTVRVWDAETGAQIGDPLAGHSHSVTSVAYSPDGRRIVSGSYDKTVRVWDAETGAQIGDPLAGHSHWVTSVAYSPDGRRIVSGSYDNTVRVWDAETGAQIGDPLAGHSDSVRSVAYSPDGRRIVSGSGDNTVRVWDAEKGAQIGDPLAGHSDLVTSVAYSPDGRRIVSGSDDKTVRVWDAETGAQIGDPLAGHSDLVTSVAYSPDGRRIVSGSYDNTVRVWDAETGAQIGDPFAGHSHSVRSVAYSPDGRRIVSGSVDKTVRVWDAETGAQIGDPLAGHSDSVRSVAHSLDGRRIVSGSNDNTTRVSDIKPRFPMPNLIAELAQSPATISIPTPPTDGKQDYPPSHHARFLASPPCVLFYINTSHLHPHCAIDGWVSIVPGELLLWLPPEYQRPVRDDSLFAISSERIPQPIWLDLSNFRHGSDWTGVYTPQTGLVRPNHT